VIDRLIPPEAVAAVAGGVEVVVVVVDAPLFGGWPCATWAKAVTVTISATAISAVKARVRTLDRLSRCLWEDWGVCW